MQEPDGLQIGCSWKFYKKWETIVKLNWILLKHNIISSNLS